MIYQGVVKYYISTILILFKFYVSKLGWGSASADLAEAEEGLKNEKVAAIIL